jgi:hypothetical protein
LTSAPGGATALRSLAMTNIQFTKAPNVRRGMV